MLVKHAEVNSQLKFIVIESLVRTGLFFRRKGAESAKEREEDLLTRIIVR